jgi:hypothetical protein
MESADFFAFACTTPDPPVVSLGAHACSIPAPPEDIITTMTEASTTSATSIDTLPPPKMPSIHIMRFFSTLDLSSASRCH